MYSNDTAVLSKTNVIKRKGPFIIYGRGGGGGMGEKMGGPEILATAKRGVLGKVFVIEGGVLKI